MLIEARIAHWKRRLRMVRPRRHSDTAIGLADLGTRYPSYQPTFRFSGRYIDDLHASLAHAGPDGLIDLGITGWLRPADALKLHELAYFTPGDVLEFGTYHGLSTYILTRAIWASNYPVCMTSLELEPEYAGEAQRHVVMPAERHSLLVGDARESAQRLIDAGRRFGFVFVDHSHSYDLVKQACQHLKRLVVPGGFALFHDFNDSRNRSDSDYGVFQAVEQSFADGSFSFWGIYGCTGLYRKTRFPKGNDAAPPLAGDQ